MSVLLSHRGPALIHGDLTAPVLVLTPDTAPCPTCGVVAKQRGATDPGEQVVLMRMRELVALFLGYRPPEVEQ